MNVRLTIQYDGTDFHGWQIQNGLRTVQGELEAALGTVLREPVKLSVAGRTDTGVHALGQVASFVTDAEISEDLARRLNGVGPDDIAVTAARRAPPASARNSRCRENHIAIMLANRPNTMSSTNTMA